MTIENLYQRIIEASDLDIDRKWSPWVKRIDSIDSTKKGGYMFVGDFIQDRTIEYEPKAGLALACARHGSRKYNQNYYQLILLHPSGDIEPIGDEVSDEDRGWALLLKPEVEKQLLTISLYYAHSDIPSADELPMKPQIPQSDLQDDDGLFDIISAGFSAGTLGTDKAIDLFKGEEMRTETVTIAVTYPSSIKSMLESGAYEVVRFSPSDVPASFYWQPGAVFLRLLEVSDDTS